MLWCTTDKNDSHTGSYITPTHTEADWSKQYLTLLVVIHVAYLTDSIAIQFLSLLDHANLTQHVSFPTHRHSHTLGLVISSANSINVMGFM